MILDIFLYICHIFFFPPAFSIGWISAEKKGTAASYKSGEDDRRDSKNHLPDRLLHVPHLFLHPLQRHFVDRHRRRQTGYSHRSSSSHVFHDVRRRFFFFFLSRFNQLHWRGGQQVRRTLNEVDSLVGGAEEGGGGEGKCSCLRSKKREREKERFRKNRNLIESKVNVASISFWVTGFVRRKR